ncbi:MAG: glycosyltransferase [Planctomycetaceae bacterium]
MMKAAWVGIRTPGTTSRLRSDALQRVLPAAEWAVIDTDLPFRSAARVWRSLAFRYRLGPAVQAMNRYVAQQLPAGQYDLIWVDKGVCLSSTTIRRLRACSHRLVYYTPDTSFLHNRSRFFYQTAALYDLVVTTKSLEVEQFGRLIGADRLLLTTQSYDSRLHYPRVSFAQKRPEAVFVGLCEPDRETCVQALLQAGVPVRLGGVGWDFFLQRNQRNPLLTFAGRSVFGEDYASTLSAASIGLGLLTKRFPELHTTRTFEIPACGTVLATESTSETARFFNASQALFFSDYSQLARRVIELLHNPATLQQLSAAGQTAVAAGGYDNDSMVRRVLQRCGLLL